MAVAACAVAGLIALGGAAGAAKPKAKSEISYANEFAPGEFIHKGRVRSESKKCVRNRTVILYNEQNPSQPIGTDKTNRKGRYRIVLGSDSLAGPYFTRVSRKPKPRIVCKRARSESKGLPF